MEGIVSAFGSVEKAVGIVKDLMNRLGFETPIYEYPFLNQEAGFPVRLKLENLARLGDVAARGYLGVMALTLAQQKVEYEKVLPGHNGVGICFPVTRGSCFRCCCHGLACTARYAKMPCHIFASLECIDLATLVMLHNCIKFGAQVHTLKTDAEARAACTKFAADSRAASDVVCEIPENLCGPFTLIGFMTAIAEIVEDNKQQAVARKLAQEAPVAIVLPSEAISFHGFSLAAAAAIYVQEMHLEKKVALCFTRSAEMTDKQKELCEIQPFTFNSTPHCIPDRVFDSWDADSNGFLTASEMLRVYNQILEQNVTDKDALAFRLVGERARESMTDSEFQVSISDFLAIFYDQISHIVHEYHNASLDMHMQYHISRYGSGVPVANITRSNELRALKSCLSHTHTYASGYSNHALAGTLFHKDKVNDAIKKVDPAGKDIIVYSVIAGGLIDAHVFDLEFQEALKIDRQIVSFIVRMANDPMKETLVYQTLAKHDFNTEKLTFDIVNHGHDVVLHFKAYAPSAEVVSEAAREVEQIPGVSSFEYLDTDPVITRELESLTKARQEFPPLSSATMRSPSPAVPLATELPKGVEIQKFVPELCGNKSADDVTLESVENAYHRLQRYNATHETFVYRSSYYSRVVNNNNGLSGAQEASVYLMLENTQQTGSFKIRGASNAIAKYYEYCKQCEDTVLKAKNPAAASKKNPIPRLTGVLACSAGNHGSGVSKICCALGIPCTIVVPETAPATKLNNMRRFGAEIVKHGAAFDQASAFGDKLCKERGSTFVPPYNSWDVIEGQATIAYELLRKQPDIDTIVVNVGGGGMISGIALYAKKFAEKRGKPIRIVGVQADVVHPFRHYKETGELVYVDPARQTLADGCNVKVGGGIHDVVLRNLVDEWVGVAENEIAASMCHCLFRTRTLTEGAGVMGLTALLYERMTVRPGEKVAIILCGGNLDLQRLSVLTVFGLKALGRLVTVTIDVPNRSGQVAKINNIVATHGLRIRQMLHQHDADNLEWDSCRITITLSGNSFESINNCLIHIMHETGFLPTIVNQGAVPNAEEVFGPFNEEKKKILAERESTQAVKKAAFEKAQHEKALKLWGK